MENLLPVFVSIIVGFVFLVGMLAMFKSFYIKVPQGTALIVNDMSSTPKVHFTGALVYPVIYKKEFMRISLITLEVDRRGKDGLICRDNMRADITVAFYLRVNETAQDVLKVAKAIGVDRASDKVAVNELFNAKFSEALKTVGKQIDFVKLFENRQEFRDRIIEVIGNDLNGYVLEDVAIDYLEQTPKSSLDPSNILDAEGIRKITELTAAQNVITNELARNEELAITKKNVETREAMLALERQQADAEARQHREIATIQAREQAETAKVQEEERLVAETLGAEARGAREKGAAEAEVIKQVGLSEAGVMREKYRSEAEGLTEKFGALDALSDQARAHEEFRMQLEKSFEQAMAGIDANKAIAREQAEVLATALAKAKIDIVGGEGAFFDSFAKALSVGKAVEGVAEKSPLVQELMQKLLSLQVGGGKSATPRASTTEDQA